MAQTTDFNQRQVQISQMNESVLAFSANAYANPQGDVKQNLIEAAANSTLLQGLDPEQGAKIGGAWGSSIKSYYESTGQFPRAEILASAGETLQALISPERFSYGTNKNFFESAAGTIDTASGQLTRSTAGAMILPSILAAATSDMATFIQGGKDKVECYKIGREVGNDFGDLEAGSIVEDGYTGQYSYMQQTYVAPVTFDGTKKEVIAYVYDEQNPLVADSALVGAIANYNPQGAPFILDSLRVIYKGEVVAKVNNESRKLSGSFSYKGQDNYINGIAAMKPAQGIIAFNLSIPLAAEDKLILQYDIDIENSDNIPEIKHSMLSFWMSPHASILGAQHTIQAYWSLNREFGINLTSFQAREQQTLLAYDRDINNLRQALIATDHAATKVIDMKLASGQYFKERYEELKRYLLELSQEMLNATKTSGLIGMYCGTGLSTMIKSLPSTLFAPVAGYRQVPRIHFCGMLFGMFKVYEVPANFRIPNSDIRLDIDEAVCYGRGEQYGQAGMVNGDAIALAMYEHGVNSKLQNRQTLWGTRFNDIHPDGGHKYFRKIKVQLV